MQTTFGREYVLGACSPPMVPELRIQVVTDAKDRNTMRTELPRPLMSFDVPAIWFFGLTNSSHAQKPNDNARSLLAQRSTC